MLKWGAAFGFFSLLLLVITLENKRSSQLVTSASVKQDEDLPAIAIDAPDAQMLEKYEQELQKTLSLSSLRGTKVNVASLVLQNGELVLHGSLLLYFDYFLSLEGEMSRSAIVELVLNDIKARYPASIANQLIDVFHRYVNYLDAVAIEHDAIAAQSSELNFEDAEQLQSYYQKAYFSEDEIQQLFESYQQMLTMNSVGRQKQKKLQHFREVVRKNPEQFESQATEIFGEAVAQRLYENERRKQQWQSRLQTYSCEKAAITSSEGLDDYAREEGVNLLKARLFSDSEIRRVNALEKSGLVEPCIS